MGAGGRSAHRVTYPTPSRSPHGSKIPLRPIRHRRRFCRAADAGAVDPTPPFAGASGSPGRRGRRACAKFGKTGTTGGTIGVAYISILSGGSGVSVNNKGFTHALVAHETGHNMGSGHSSGGIMNASIITGSRSFFQDVSTGETAAKDIYDHTRSRIYGSARMRHPEQIPFARDDDQSTPVNTAHRFDPTSNDERSVRNGATNTTLTVDEVSRVNPMHAGVVELVGLANLLEFALGASPIEASPPPLTISLSPDGGAIHLTFTQRTADIIATVESSTNRTATWLPEQAVTTISATPLPGGVHEQITLSITLPHTLLRLSVRFDDRSPQ